MVKKSTGGSGPSTLMIQNKTLKKELNQAKGRLKLLEHQISLCTCGAGRHHAVICPRCEFKLQQTSPIVKQPCPNCQREGINVVLSSQAV